MDVADDARRLLDVLALSERLKRELRHSWLSDGRRESVAEHTFQMGLMAMLIAPKLTAPVDMARALKMILVHDLVEALAGDAPFFEKSERKDGKPAREQAAMVEIEARVGGALGAEIRALWQAFEAAEDAEARLARALDHLEVQIQHNLADISTWEPVEYALVYTKMDRACAQDPYLSAICEAVKAAAEEKMAAAGIDVAAVKAGANALRSHPKA